MIPAFRAPNAPDRRASREPIKVTNSSKLPADGVKPKRVGLVDVSPCSASTRELHKYLYAISHKITYGPCILANLPAQQGETGYALTAISANQSGLSGPLRPPENSGTFPQVRARSIGLCNDRFRLFRPPP
jgi:hypothetical protein